MAMKIMWAAAIFFGGWLFSYLFVRQLAFNFTTAYPMIKKMRALDKELIAPGADKYTHISVLVCILVILVVTAIVVRFCKLYLIVSFAVGVISAILLFLPHLNSSMKSLNSCLCSSLTSITTPGFSAKSVFTTSPSAQMS